MFDGADVNGDDPPGTPPPEKLGGAPCEYNDPLALPMGPPEPMPLGGGEPLGPDGPQLPPPQFLQPITADNRMAPCSHQKRLDFLIFDSFPCEPRNGPGSTPRSPFQTAPCTAAPPRLIIGISVGEGLTSSPHARFFRKSRSTQRAAHWAE